jgi:cobalt-zinc-cadmium efflux system outer membrane protein
LEELALKVHPVLKVTGEEVRKAEADWRISRQYPNPEVETEVSSQKLKEGNISGTGYSVTVSQKMEWFGRRAKKQEAAQYGIEASKNILDNERVAVKAKLQELFYRLLATSRLQQLTAQNLDAAQKLLELVEKRVRLGESRHLELIKARVDYANQEQEDEKAKSVLAADREVLNRFLGSNLEPTFKVKGDLTNLDPLIPLERWRQSALNSHPQLAAQETTIRQAESNLQAERQAWVPDLTFKVFRNDDIDRRDVGGGVTIEIPIWNRKGGEVAKAAAVQRQSQAELQVLRQELETKLIAQYNLYQVARRQVQTLQQNILPDAAESLRLAQLTYQHGETGLLELLDSLRIYRATQRDYYTNLLDYRLAQVELWRLTGGGIKH